MSLKLTKKQFLTSIFKSIIYMVYFLSETYLGFALYLFCLFFCIAGKNKETYSFYYYVCLLFIFFSLSLVFINFLFMKNIFLRTFISNYVGDTFIIEYLGPFSGTQPLMKLAATTLSVVGAEVATQQSAVFEAKQRANEVMRHARDACGDTPLDRCGVHKDAFKKAAAILSKEQVGVVRKAMDQAAQADMLEKAKEAAGGIFGSGRK